MSRSLPQKAAELALSTPRARPVKSQPRVISEGRYRITARPDGALVIAWFPEGEDGGGVITLPPVIARLIDRAAGGEQISPAMVLRAMRG